MYNRAFRITHSNQVPIHIVCVCRVRVRVCVLGGCKLASYSKLLKCNENKHSDHVEYDWNGMCLDYLAVMLLQETFEQGTALNLS